MGHLQSYVIVAILLSLTTSTTLHEPLSTSATDAPPGSKIVAYGAYMLKISADGGEQQHMEENGRNSNVHDGTTSSPALNHYDPSETSNNETPNYNRCEIGPGRSTCKYTILPTPDSKAPEVLTCRLIRAVVVGCGSTTTTTEPTIFVTKTATVAAPTHRMNVGNDTRSRPPKCRDIQDYFCFYLMGWWITLRMLGGCHILMIEVLRTIAKRNVTKDDMWQENFAATRNMVPFTLLLTLRNPLTACVDSVATNDTVPVVVKLLVPGAVAMMVLWAIQIYMTGYLPIINPGATVASRFWHAWRTGNRLVLGDLFEGRSEAGTFRRTTKVVEQKADISEQQEGMFASSHEITEEHQSDMEAWQIVRGADMED